MVQCWIQIQYVTVSICPPRCYDLPSVPHLQKFHSCGVLYSNYLCCDICPGIPAEDILDKLKYIILHKAFSGYYFALNRQDLSLSYWRKLIIGGDECFGYLTGSNRMRAPRKECPAPWVINIYIHHLCFVERILVFSRFFLSEKMYVSILSPHFSMACYWQTYIWQSVTGRTLQMFCVLYYSAIINMWMGPHLAFRENRNIPYLYSW